MERKPIKFVILEHKRKSISNVSTPPINFVVVIKNFPHILFLKVIIPDVIVVQELLDVTTIVLAYNNCLLISIYKRLRVIIKENNYVLRLPLWFVILKHFDQQ